VEVECRRVLDRLRLQLRPDVDVVAAWHVTLTELLSEFEIVHAARSVLTRAAQPLPVPLGTLDALHLATALEWQEARETPIVMATHDRSLARASRALGLEVVGTQP
jgi:predicted nucleic acid-binding protein